MASYQPLVDLFVPSCIGERMVLAFALLRQLWIAERLTKLLDVMSPHRPALRKIHHRAEKLTERDMIIGCVVSPEFWLAIFLRINKGHEVALDLKMVAPRAGRITAIDRLAIDVADVTVMDMPPEVPSWLIWRFWRSGVGRADDVWRL